MVPRFEYPMPTTAKVRPGDVVWFRLDGAAGIDSVHRAPCLEYGQKNNRAYKVETAHGLFVWSDEITQIVRPYQPGDWLL